MALADLSDPAAVVRAIEEFDAIGREAFLERYGFGPARQFFVGYYSRHYDSKAILGAAHGFEFPEQGPLSHADFSGGEPTVRKLMELGFSVVQMGAETRGLRVFGHVALSPPGSTFDNRRELADAAVHRPLQAGISYTESDGADSIVISGGYEDDEDYGDLIIYTGHGGNDPATGHQIEDQQFRRGNLALARNADEGRPVRVVRGAGGNPQHSPATGFRYDGLYAVDAYWSDVGRSGFLIWRYRLIKLDDPAELRRAEPEEPDAEKPTPRADVTVQRLVRSTQVTRHVKELYDHTCQVCGTRVDTLAGPYAEGAHIRALGRPHDGPDVVGNVLCLCPNDHVRFDKGAIVITDELDVIDRTMGQVIAKLRTVAVHRIDVEHLRYHRAHFAESA
jgi:putative restriction endonuclease